MTRQRYQQLRRAVEQGRAVAAAVVPYFNGDFAGYPIVIETIAPLRKRDDTRIWDADPAVREMGCPGIGAAEKWLEKVTKRNAEPGETR